MKERASLHQQEAYLGMFGPSCPRGEFPVGYSGLICTNPYSLVAAGVSGVDSGRSDNDDGAP